MENEDRIYNFTKAITQTIEERNVLKNLLAKADEDRYLLTEEVRKITFTSSELKSMINIKESQIMRMIELLDKELGVKE